MTTTDPAEQAAIDLGDDPTSTTADIIRAAYAPLLRQAMEALAETEHAALDQRHSDALAALRAALGE